MCRFQNMDKEIEVQRGEVACPLLQTYWVVEAGFRSVFRSLCCFKEGENGAEMAPLLASNGLTEVGEGRRCLASDNYPLLLTDHGQAVKNWSIPHTGDSLDPVLAAVDVGIYSVAVLLSTVFTPGHCAHQVPMASLSIQGHHGTSRVTRTGVFPP